MTLNVAATAIPGTYNTILLRGTSAGLTDVTVALPLTITAVGNFTLAAAPATISAVQGAGGTTVVNATRSGGFSGALTFAVTTASGAALPAGLTAAVTSTATADSYTLTTNAAASLAPGVYNVLVTATSPGVSAQSVAVAITVTAPASLARLDFSACAQVQKPIWLAYQDGSGAWTTVTPSGDVYQFSITASTGGYTYVVAPGTSFITRVYYFAKSEAGTVTPACGGDLPGTGKTLHGTFTGLQSSTDRATFSLAGSWNGQNQSASTFQLNVIPTGAWDLLAYRRSGVSPASDRMLIRRDQDIPDGGSFAPIDFNSSEALPSASAQITLSGVAANESISQSMYYRTGAACSAMGFLYSGSSTGPAVTVNGWPSTAPQRATDLHLMELLSFNGANGRGIAYAAHTLVDRTLQMPTYPTPVVTSSATSYKRLQIVVPVAPDYDSGFIIYYDGTSTHSVVLTESPGYVAGATSGTFLMPDLSAASGFLPSWEPAASASTNWSVNLFTSSWPFQLCTDGAIARYVTVAGTN